MSQIEALMRRVRQELAERKIENVSAFLRWEDSTTPSNKNLYLLRELVRRDGEPFVRNAYAALLKRDPDPAGLQYYSELLRNGVLDKLEVIRRIVGSPEGRAAGVHVIGLRPSQPGDPGQPSDREPLKGPQEAADISLLGISERGNYHIREFLKLGDARAVVQGAYRALLGREPEAPALARYVRAMEAGTVAPVEVIGAIRFSPEGRRRSVRVRGLLTPLVVEKVTRAIGASRWTLPGRASRATDSAVMAALKALQLQVQEQGAAVTSVTEEQRSLADRVANLEAAMEQLAASVAMDSELATVTQRLEQLRRAIRWLGDHQASRSEMIQLTSGLQAVGVALADFDRRRDSLETHVRVAITALQENVASIDASLQQRTRELIQVRNQLTRGGDKRDANFSPRQPSGAGQDSDDDGDAGDSTLSSLYLAFEDRFRGTREDIRERLKVYLPVISRAAANPVVLDVGCGRGELLELLRENNIGARGVDTNTFSVQSCWENGLDVVCQDGIDYLHEQPAESLDAVVALHVIEHLPFRRFVELVDVAMRVLRPGGIVIFETPNPENIQVGACTFFYDPTHRNPLPPDSTKFVIQERGFKEVEIWRLHPYPDEAQLKGTDPDTKVLNGLLFSARDYALLARK